MRETRAASALEAATGLCKGTPQGAEIEGARPGGLDGRWRPSSARVTQRLERADRGQGQALVITATA